jgi:hypothetical protein
MHVYNTLAFGHTLRVLSVHTHKHDVRDLRYQETSNSQGYRLLYTVMER